ncbi:MAG: response regulator transcription factor [Tepidisphaeraceae bacterium]
MSERHSVILVDDHPILRQGLAKLIEGEPDLTVCAEAATAAEALTAAESHRPALAVVDLNLDGKPNLELIRQLRQANPELRVLVLSMHDEEQWAGRVLQAGACGYVMKQENPRTLLARMRQALAGETAVSPAVASMMLRALTWDREAAKPEGVDRLGDRERQVLHLIGKGQSTRDVAAALHISVKTVDAHREHIKQKLGLRTAAELVRFAVLHAEQQT